MLGVGVAVGVAVAVGVGVGVAVACPLDALDHAELGSRSGWAIARRPSAVTTIAISLGCAALGGWRELGRMGIFLRGG